MTQSISIQLIILLTVIFLGAVLINKQVQAESGCIGSNTDHVKAFSQEELMKQKELEATGKALRQEVDAKYQELEAPGGAFYAPNGNFYKADPNGPYEAFRSVDVTEIAAKYIPNGASAEDAVAILRAAGFNPEPTGKGTAFNQARPYLSDDLEAQKPGIMSGLSIAANMRWFIGFGISAKITGDNCIFNVQAGFSKQVH